MDADDLQGDLPKYSATKHRCYAYHDDEDCPRLDQSEVHERSAEYIDWHELTPCPYCHDDLEPQEDKAKYGQSLAKDIRHGDAEVGSDV